MYSQEDRYDIQHLLFNSSPIVKFVRPTLMKDLNRSYSRNDSHTRLMAVFHLRTSQESKSELEKFTGVTVMIGDAMDEAAIQKCMQGKPVIKVATLPDI